MLIKDNYLKDIIWDKGMFSLKPEEMNLISETNIKSPEWLEDFKDAYLSGEFFWAGGNIKKQYTIRDRRGSFWTPSIKKYGNIYEICSNQNDIYFYVLDEYPGHPDKLILRVLMCFNASVGLKKYYSIYEVGRWILCPGNKSIYSVRLPDDRYNPSESYYPFIEGHDTFRYSVKLKGGLGVSAGLGNLDESLFWEKHTIPGVNIPKDIFKELQEQSKLPEKDRWGYEYNRRYHFTGDKSTCLKLFFEDSFLRRLLENCPWFLKCIYGENGNEDFYIKLSNRNEKFLLEKLNSGWVPTTIEEL